jgi:RES domain-containing protein
MQQHPQSATLLRTLEQSLRWAQAWEGTVYRCTTMAYANRADLLSGAGSRHHGGRWNPPNRFNVIYGSLDAETAVAESLTTISAYGVPAERASPRVFVAVRLKLQRVLDLTSPQFVKLAKWDFSAIAKEDWQSLQQAGVESLGQAIGRVGWDLQLEAFLAPSFRRANGQNIVLFPGRRLRGSSWRIQGARELPKKLR